MIIKLIQRERLNTDPVRSTNKQHNYTHCVLYTTLYCTTALRHTIMTVANNHNCPYPKLVDR